MLMQLGQFEECATPGYPFGVLLEHHQTGEELMFNVIAEAETFVAVKKAVDELRQMMGGKLAGFGLREWW